MLKNPKNFRRAIVIAFLSVPFLASLISTVHVVDLFNLGNLTWMSIVLAVLFEAGQLASLLAIAVLGKLNKFFVWSIFGLLALMQIIGNVYYSFDFMTAKLATDPNWLDTIKELMDFFTYRPFEITQVKAILSMVLGGIIPLVSIAFLKSLTDYLKPEALDKVDETIDETIEEVRNNDNDEIEETIEIENTDDIENDIETEEITEEEKEEPGNPKIQFPLPPKNDS